jgi:hypothetical protein
MSMLVPIGWHVAEEAVPSGITVVETGALFQENVSYPFAGSAVSFNESLAVGDIIFLFQSTQESAGDVGLGLVVDGEGSPTAFFTDLFPDAEEQDTFYSLQYRQVTDLSHTYGLNSGSPGVNVSCYAVVRGADASSIVTPTEADGGTGDPDPPSITTADANSLVIAFGSIENAGVTVSAAPSNYENLAWEGDGNDAEVAGMVATRLIETAGAENPSAFTTSGSTDWVAVSVAVAPL